MTITELKIKVILHKCHLKAREEFFKGVIRELNKAIKETPNKDLRKALKKEIEMEKLHLKSYESHGERRKEWKKEDRKLRSKRGKEDK